MFCNKCGKEISNDSRVCKFCGNTVSQQQTINYNINTANTVRTKKKVYQQWWFWLIIIFLAVGIIGTAISGDSENIATRGNINSNEDKTQERQEDILKMNYEVLHKEYMDNPIAADAKYKGKTLQLTGKVDNIDREIAGNTYITFHVGEKYSFQDIRITFKKSQESEVAKLKKGQQITIQGECRGTLLSTTVSLNNCEIIK